MSRLFFRDQGYSLDPQETVLECMLRHDIAYPNACRAGVCHSCLIKAEDGVVNPLWQRGLPDTLKVQGYFLACIAQPETELILLAPDSTECDIPAEIQALTWLNRNVLQVKLGVTDNTIWIPGQYLNLLNEQGVVRSYSIANIPVQEGFIELHVKIYPDGMMGQWFANEALVGNRVTLRGPFGHCFYHNPDRQAFDIVLAGTGTGLAPLLAVAKSALSHDHPGKITLVHGGVTDEDMYYQEELTTLAALFPSFYYDPCVLKSQGLFPEAAVEKRVLNSLQNPSATRVYVCGPKATTDKLKKQIFLAGVPSSAILSDTFL